ncbi:MAG: AraC family transcriptional regulator ligand-binding domain-containing protein [Steroidobacteraceae bacterium]
MAHPLDPLPCPSTYTRLMLQRWPAAAARVLAGTSLTPEALVRQGSVTVAEQLQIFRNARALAARPDWALDFGRQLNINSHGPLGFASVSAPTLGEGISMLAAFARIRAPYLDFRVAERDRQLVLEFITTAYPLDDLGQPFVEILQQIARSYTHAVLGEDNTDAVHYFSRGAHGHASRYRAALGPRCEFSAGFDGVGVPAALTALPCPLHDEKIYRSSLSRCREALAAVLAEGDVVARATHWLAAHFEQIATQRKFTSLPRLEQLAEAWGVTPRTVIRRLAEHDVRFGDLRAAQQLEMARRMLDDASYTVSDVGYRLGYGDPANFGRAFKRMTGQSPGEYRRRTRAS